MYPDHQRIEVIQSVWQDPRKDQRRYLFNMGGPMSRTRTETIHATILANPDKPIKCPLVISLGLDFKKKPPASTMEALLKAEGFSSPEELRMEYLTLNKTFVCHVSLTPARLPVASSPAKLVLIQAVILGLCTSTYFNPGRPILWTSASLTRCLDLYNMEDFYL